MPLSAAGPSRFLIAGFASGFLLAALPSALAQTPPETLRINVEPAKPGIRSITMERKYRPIISRDDAGVVIDTLGSETAPPPCNVELEVTLENSRVLHRKADICSGGTLVVDVNSDGKPGKARVIGGTPGAVSAPAAPAAPAATVDASQPETKITPAPQDTPAPAAGLGSEDTPARQDGNLMKPLEQVDIDGTAATSLPATAGENLDQQSGGFTPAPGQDAVTVSQNDARVWTTQTSGAAGARSDLFHGVPETDDTDFRAACLTQSGQATIVFSQTSPTTAEGLTESVRVTADGFSMTYPAVGGSANNQFGQSFPQIVLATTDPLWQTLISKSVLTIQIEGLPAYQVSLKGSAKPVRLFVATCAEPQHIIGETGVPGAPGTIVAAGADVSCGEVGRIRSLDGIRPGQIVFRNTSREAVDVHWIDYNGGEHVYARLNPGQILDQQTYVTHAWLVRRANGQCLGIYVSRTPYREVVISGGAAPSAPGQPFGYPQTPAPAGPVPPGTIGGNAGPTFNNGGGFAAAPANGTVADYLCTAGVDLQVTFSADGSSATVAEIGRGVVTLRRQGGGSSFHYSSQGYTLKGQIQNTTWTRPGLRDVFCAKR